MKFKIAVTGLLTAILTVCIFTSYTLINEAKRQTEEAVKQTAIQTINTKVSIIIGERVTDDTQYGQLSHAHQELIEIVGSQATIVGWTKEEYESRFGNK